MVTEYIKRNQRMGYGEGRLVYKIYMDDEPPVVDVSTEEPAMGAIEEESIPSIEPNTFDSL